MKLVFLLFFGFALPTYAKVFEAQIEQTSPQLGNSCECRLWLPPGSHPNQVLVVVWGSNQCSLGIVEDPAWQQLASSINCALLACFFCPQTSSNPWDHADKGSGAALLEAIRSLAVTTGESQLTNASLYLVGDSQGGQFSFHFAGWKPSRVLGFISLKGGRHEATSINEAKDIPGLFFLGQLDEKFRITNIIHTFTQGRAMGAPWCLAIDPNAGHEPGRCGFLLRAFLQQLSKAPAGNVLPSAKATTDMDESSEFTIPKSWFPSQQFKRDWQLFKTGALPPLLPKLGFESKMPALPGSVTPTSFNLGSIDSGERSQVLSLQVIPSLPSAWDDVTILHAPYLRATKDPTIISGSAAVSFQFNTIGLPLGRFSGLIPLRFVCNRKAILGGINVPITAIVTGDLIAKPLFVDLGAIHPHSKISVPIEISSKTGAPITFLACQAPAQLESNSSHGPTNPLSLNLSFTFGQGLLGESISGSILLHLKTTKEWVIRLPYVGSFTE